MIDKYVNSESCFGCWSCHNACPKKAINMEQDSIGFLHPRVDYSVCINCGVCKKACPSINQYVSKPRLPNVFSTRIKDNGTLFQSTSGGIFTAITDFVLDVGGFVCGAIFDDNYQVQHIVANTKEERNQMRGAKYVQSNINDSFCKIKFLLDSGNLVLFSGTSCQVHALKLFLKKEYDSLITIDIVCHGVPSYKMWSNYLSFIEKKYGEIDYLRFRSKKIGWRGNNLEIALKSGKVLLGTRDSKKYTSLYGEGFLMRDKCYSCPYTTIFRIGDFSIGDCWGLEKLNSTLNDNNGCSLLFINNEKAYKIFNKIKDCLIVEERTIPEILQPNLLKPTKKPNKINEIREKLFESNFWKKLR